MLVCFVGLVFQYVSVVFASLGYWSILVASESPCASQTCLNIRWFSKKCFETCEVSRGPTAYWKEWHESAIQRGMIQQFAKVFVEGSQVLKSASHSSRALILPSAAAYGSRIVYAKPCKEPGPVVLRQVFVFVIFRVFGSPVCFRSLILGRPCILATKACSSLGISAQPWRIVALLRNVFLVTYSKLTSVQQTTELAMAWAMFGGYEVGVQDVLGAAKHVVHSIRCSFRDSTPQVAAEVVWPGCPPAGRLAPEAKAARVRCFCNGTNAALILRESNDVTMRHIIIGKLN